MKLWATKSTGKLPTCRQWSTRTERVKSTSKPAQPTYCSAHVIFYTLRVHVTRTGNKNLISLLSHHDINLYIRLIILSVGDTKSKGSSVSHVWCTVTRLSHYWLQDVSMWIALNNISSVEQGTGSIVSVQQLRKVCTVFCLCIRLLVSRMVVRRSMLTASLSLSTAVTVAMYSWCVRWRMVTSHKLSLPRDFSRLNNTYCRAKFTIHTTIWLVHRIWSVRFSNIEHKGERK